MTTSTHSHKVWTDEGGHVTSMAARNRFAEAFGYGVAVVGMEHQWLSASFVDPLADAGLAPPLSV